MPHSVFLDLDGTLIDSCPGIQASCLATLRALGHEPQEPLEIRSLIGPPLQEVLALLLHRYGDHRVDEAVIAYRQHYGEKGYLGCALYPGIAEALTEMRRAGGNLYLATSKREVFARRILDHLGLTSLFVAIHGSTPDGQLDQKPDLLAQVLSRHGLTPARCLMIGDRRHDIVGAHAVGLRAAGVLWGYGTWDELVAAGADHLVAAPDALAPAVQVVFSRAE